MEPKRIVILAGGWSGEREVSLNSGAQCAQALARAGHDLVVIDPARELPRLVDLAPSLDAVLILLHGPFGEDGRVQGLLDCLGLPYPGAGVASSVISIDKALSKERYLEAGLKVAPDVTLLAGQAGREKDLVNELGLPFIVKPAREGSTLGLTLVENEEDLAPALETAFSHDDKVIVEKYLAGTELTAGVLDLPGQGLTALPVIEIRPKRSNLFNYECKYTPGACEEICPAPISQAASLKAQAAALTAHQVLGISHWSRTDFILVEEEIYVLETNTIPGMTVTSLFPQAAAAAGLSLDRLLERLVELAIRDRGPKA
ncbi:MAG: D-alanine--D-alanine ligase [Deltaproteobacteria bacterium]|nr:D-alanine--D-alanine ligase [Deltaproteobacteria bacterium]